MCSRPGCEGKVIKKLTMREITRAPVVEEGDTLYLDYVAPGIGTYRPKGPITGESYYFVSSPRNKKGKRVVRKQPPYTADEISFEDAVALSTLRMGNHNLFGWRIEKAPVEEKPKIAIGSLTIGKAQEMLGEMSTEELNQFLAEEKQGKNRAGMLSLLEGLLDEEE